MVCAVIREDILSVIYIYSGPRVYPGQDGSRCLFRRMCFGFMMSSTHLVLSPVTEFAIGVPYGLYLLLLPLCSLLDATHLRIRLAEWWEGGKKINRKGRMVCSRNKDTLWTYRCFRAPGRGEEPFGAGGGGWQGTCLAELFSLTGTCAGLGSAASLCVTAVLQSCLCLTFMLCSQVSHVWLKILLRSPD